MRGSLPDINLAGFHIGSSPRTYSTGLSTTPVGIQPISSSPFYPSSSYQQSNLRGVEEEGQISGDERDERKLREMSVDKDNDEGGDEMESWDEAQGMEMEMDE